MSKAKDLFEEELNALEALDRDSAYEAWRLYKDGEASSFERLVNGCQKRIYDAAKLFSPDDELFMDLIQEGNVALMRFFEETESDPESFEAEVQNAIRDGMMRFLEEEEENRKAGEELKTKLNVMDAITMKIAEEENREATPEEIAELMHISTDDVRYLMHIALTALEKENA